VRDSTTTQKTLINHWIMKAKMVGLCDALHHVAGKTVGHDFLSFLFDSGFSPAH